MGFFDKLKSGLGKTKNSINEKESFQLALKEKVERLNPLIVLNKGYAKLESEGKSIVSVTDVKNGDDINIYLCDGKLIAKVGDIKNGL